MQEWITDIPLVVWLLALALAVAAFAGLCYAIARKAHEHGLNFILSPSFGLLLLVASVTLLSAGLPLLGAENEEARQAAEQNLTWGGVIFGISAVLALIYNALKSTVLLAIPFTVLQAIISWLTAIILIYLILKLIERNKKKGA